MKAARAKLKAYLALPERLRDLIEQSLFFMRAHPEHMLNFGYRYAIYATIGAEYPSRPRVDVLGHKRRAYLNILTAEYLLPTWNACLAKNPKGKMFKGYPQSILEAARDILFKGIEFATHKWLDLKRSPHIQSSNYLNRPFKDDQEKWASVRVSLHDFDNLAPKLTYNDQCELLGSGVAAVSALQVTLRDDDYLYENTDFSITEEITDYYGWDNAYNAMISISHGTSKDSDKFKRKAFWEWWLLSAVPDAYNQFPS